MGGLLPIMETKRAEQSRQVAHREVGSWENAVSDLVKGKQSVCGEKVCRESCGLFYGKECCLDLLITSPLIFGMIVIGQMLSC